MQSINFNYNMKYNLEVNITIGQVINIGNKPHVVSSYRLYPEDINRGIMYGLLGVKICEIDFTDDNKILINGRARNTGYVTDFLTRKSYPFGLSGLIRISKYDLPKDLINFTRQISPNE